MTPTPPRLAAVGLACAYGERTVLHGFDLAAEPGSVTALLGPNGAGKSTALRALSRLLRPRQGAVTLDGREIWQLPRRRFVAHVAFMPQVETAGWPMTVEQVVLLGRLPHRGWLLPYSRHEWLIHASIRRPSGSSDPSRNLLDAGCLCRLSPSTCAIRSSSSPCCAASLGSTASPWC